MTRPDSVDGRVRDHTERRLHLFQRHWVNWHHVVPGLGNPLLARLFIDYRDVRIPHILSPCS